MIILISAQHKLIINNIIIKWVPTELNAGGNPAISYLAFHPERGVSRITPKENWDNLSQRWPLGLMQSLNPEM